MVGIIIDQIKTRKNVSLFQSFVVLFFQIIDAINPNHETLDFTMFLSTANNKVKLSLDLTIIFLVYKYGIFCRKVPKIIDFYSILDV